MKKSRFSGSQIQAIFGKARIFPRLDRHDVVCEILDTDAGLFAPTPGLSIG